MQIVIPMSGTGSRFVQAGYTAIKPLIEVDGRPMIEHVVRMFPGEQNVLFICSREHLRQTSLSATLERLVPSAKIVGIPPHRRGPVHAALEAKAWISDDEPVILNYCDFTVHWDYCDFKRTVEARGCAAAMTVYRGFHPHSLGQNLYAYLRAKDRTLLEIREKQYFTDDRMSEYASAGTYYFKKGGLLKTYFQRAIERDLQTHGEYYASMPYNLMVGDELEVFLYELEHFVQLGTPEDLEAYQAWSTYFARYAGWKPRRTPRIGVNLIPMAGEGTRFKREGYQQPKPLVPVDGIPMVQRAFGGLPPAATWLAVCRSDHGDHSALERIVTEGDQNVQILNINGPTAGQVCSCMEARERVDQAASLFIGPCDAVAVYDEERYAALISDPSTGCLVFTFRNHPHANLYPEQYGWVRATPDSQIQGISCKVPISTHVHRDPGIIGMFWFREGRFFFEAAEALIAQQRRINGEFYVDSAIEVLRAQGRRARLFDVDHYISFGSPDDVRTYEYWAAYFRKHADHPYGKDATQGG